MSWNWSHTVEAKNNVIKNIQLLDDEVLIEVYAEWSCAWYDDQTGEYDLIEAKMWTARNTARSFIDAEARDIVEEAVIDKVFNLAICDNGGFRAWICPFGCHTVSFDNANSDERLSL